MSQRRRPTQKPTARPTVLVLGRARARLALVQKALRRYGVRTVTIGWRAPSSGLWRLGARAPQLIVVDVPPPMTANQVDVLQRLRDRWEHVPQIVITWDASPSALTSLLALGVDDFVSAEQSWAELAVRVRRLLRRATATPLPLGPESLALDAAKRTASAHGRRVVLTSREFEVLRCLAEHPGATLTREQILDCVWGDTDDPPTSPGIVGVYVLYLRRKLGKLGLAHALRTVKGEGYVFQSPGAYWAPDPSSALAAGRASRLADSRDSDAAVAPGDGDVDVPTEAKENPHKAIRRKPL